MLLLIIHHKRFADHISGSRQTTAAGKSTAMSQPGTLNIYNLH